MRLLANPLFLRMAAVAMAAGLAFVIGLFVIRQMRRNVQQEAALGEGDPSTGSFPLHTYHAVIQQLKQQKHELLTLQQAERRRAKTSENISGAVLSNLSSGVLFFNTAGLVRQANAAAKNILGFQSPIGMNARELFRDTSGHGRSSLTVNVADGIAATIKSASSFGASDAEYVTPAGEDRVLQVTVSPVYAANAELLGAACLVNDQTEIAHMRREQELHGEMSAEMALELRNSVALISQYARDLASSKVPEANRVAADIAREAEHLEKSLGGFLAARRNAAANA